MARWWRRSGSETGSESTAPQPVSPAAAASPPVQRAAWQDLPPLRPMLTHTPPIAPLDTFTSSLATARDPSFLAPLGHIVDPDGPSGHVDGLAAPVVPQTVSGGPELAVAPRRKLSISSMVQRMIEPRMRFADPPARSAATVPVGSAADPASVTASRSFAEPDPVSRSFADPDPVSETVSSAPDSADPVFEPISWELHAVSPSAPSVRSVPLLSAPQQDPVSNLPVVGSSVSSAAPPAVPPAVQRMSVDGHGQSPTGGGGESPGDPAGENSGDSDSSAPLLAAAESTVDSPVAPLLAVTEPAANWPAPTTSAPSTFAPITSVPTKSALTSPVVGHTKMPTVSRIDDGMPAASPGGSAESPSFRPDPTVPAESAARSTEPTTDLIPAAGRAPLADKLPPAATPVQRHAEPPATGPVQRHAEPAATGHVQPPADPPASGAQPSPIPARVARTSGLGAPLTAVPSRPSETVVREPQTMDFAGIMRMIDSAAASGSTEIALPAPGAAPSPPSSTGRPVIGSTAGSPAGPRPRGLGAPLNSVPGPSPVQRSVIDGLPPRRPEPAGPLVKPGSAQAMPEPGASEPERGADPLPGAIDAAPAEAGKQVVEPMSTMDSSLADSPEPAIAPTLGADTLPVPADNTTDEVVSMDVPAVQRTAEPAAHPIAQRATKRAARPAAEPAVQPTAESAVQRSATPAPLVQRAIAPLLGDTSPLLPTSVRPALATDGQIPSGPGVQPLQRFMDPGVTGGHDGGGGSGPVFAVPVQRFGLSDASSLLDSARHGVGGLADSARSAAGNAVDSARRAAGGAQGAAGGLIDRALGYADSAQGTAGGLIDRARGYASGAQNAAGGYLGAAQDAVRGAAGGAVDQASGALGAAQGAVGQAVGNASSAASGAASGAVNQATGMVNAAQGAVGQAVGDATSAASSAASGATTGISNAITGAAGAAAGAAGAAAGAAADALPTNLDELARRLFDPLSARLKSELWMDRERAGMVTDLRR